MRTRKMILAVVFAIMVLLSSCDKDPCKKTACNPSGTPFPTLAPNEWP